MIGDSERRYGSVARKTQKLPRLEYSVGIFDPPAVGLIHTNDNHVMHRYLRAVKMC
jgi:hypothetical protein